MGSGDRVCIVPHLGLGDMILLNGLVRKACMANAEVMLFVKKAYISSLRSLFEDLANLRLRFVEEQHALYADGANALATVVKQGYELVLLGQHSGSNEWKKLHPLWSKALYRQVGMDPEDMYALFHVNRPTARENAMLEAVRAAVGDVYVVVHDDASRGMTIDASHLPPGMPVVHVDDARWRTNNIFDYATVIDNAMQFHGFDSCFMLMADFLNLKTEKFCHAYLKDADMPANFYKHHVNMIRSRK